MRSIEVRHKGSYLGFVWSFLRPLLMLGLYVFVFGYLFKNGFGVLKHETAAVLALEMFTGLSLFQMLSEVIATSPATIVVQPNFVKRVVFPLEVLPVASVGASLFHYVVSLVLLILGSIFFGPGLAPSFLWMPVIVFPVILMALGLGWFISAVGVFLRDISQAAEFFCQVLMYTSAVVYSPERIRTLAPWAWPVLRFNPVIYAIDLSRDSLLWDIPLNGRHLAYLYLCGAAIFLAGYAVFSKLKPAFADVI